jgi:hypothetical protein
MLDSLREQSSNLCIDEVALLPKELSVPMSKENTVFVSKKERQLPGDKSFLTRCNSSKENSALVSKKERQLPGDKSFLTRCNSSKENTALVSE